MGFKLNSPGCTCCGQGEEEVVCPIECYNSSNEWQYASSNTIQCDVVPPDTVYARTGSGTPGGILEFTGLSILSGVYEFSLEKNIFNLCEVPAEVDVSSYSGINLNQYGYNLCAGGPFVTTNIPVTRLTYAPVFSGGTLAIDSYRINGMKFRFYQSTPPVAFVDLEFVDDAGLGPTCTGGDLVISHTPVFDSESTCPAYFTPNSVCGTFEFV